MSRRSAPDVSAADTDLSVILAAHDFEEVALACHHLSRQSIAERIELVLVMPEEAAAPEGGDLDRFGLVTIVRIETIRPRSIANTAGVRTARSSIVVLTEDHVFVEEGWAESLVEDHDGPWVAVGPQVVNANSATAVSWADFVIGYGPWAWPRQGGDASFLPGHNTSYKRQVLLDYGEQLEPMLAAETLMHWDLAARGHRLLLSSGARIRHMNFSRLGIWIRVQVLAGRVFAGLRAEEWGRAKRLAYVAASPLIPFVRLIRLAETFRHGRSADGERTRRRAPLSSAPMTLAGLLLDGLGQALGYAFGAGTCEATLAPFEFRRIEYVTSADRARFRHETAGGVPAVTPPAS